MNEQREAAALSWAAVVRESVDGTIREILPSLDRESLPGIKLEMLLREYPWCRMGHSCRGIRFLPCIPCTRDPVFEETPCGVTLPLRQ